MNMPDIVERTHLHALGLQLAIRLRYAAETWGGLEPFVTRSLSGYPESGEIPGPAIDWQTALGIKLLWVVAASGRQHPLTAMAYRFSGARHLANKSHEALYRRVLDHCARAPRPRRDMPIPEFDWRTRSPADFHAAFIERPHPVVLRGLAADSKAGRTWTFASFVERFGHEQVLLTTAEVDGARGELAEVDSDKVYVHNSEVLFRRYPELVAELPLDRLEAFSELRPTHLQLFLGRAGTGTPFHSAGTWNWFFNVSGRKTWYFVDPRHGFLMYPVNGLGQAASFSLCPYPDDFDEDFFPAFAHCPIFEVTLEPGDVLLNPPWWWHAVRNVSETTVGVASRWIGGAQVGADLRMPEHDYDIDRMRSWLFFAGLRGVPYMHGILRNPSPVLDDGTTVREQRGRFIDLQRRMASEAMFGIRHRF